MVSSTHDATRFPLSAIRPAWNAYNVITYGVGIFIDESSTHFLVHKQYAFVIRKQKLIFGHIVYNIVDNDGNVLSDRNERYRSARICRALTEEYGLYIARKNSNDGK